jgi:hypothetical protein
MTGRGDHRPSVSEYNPRRTETDFNLTTGEDMLGSDILEVSIGVVFVFVLISTICTAVREGIEAWLKTRASYLEFGIRQLLNDPRGSGITKQLFDHPLLSGLFIGTYETDKDAKPKRRLFVRDKNLPSYIPSRNFAVALMDIAARGPVDQGVLDAGGPELSVANIRANIASIHNPHVQRALLAAVDAAQDDLARTQANLEAWYDSAMDRVSGWYKRSTQNILFVISLVVVVTLNVNTITITDYLFRHDTVRSTIVASIENPSGYEDAKKRLDELHLPVGWTGDGLEASWGAPRTRSERASLAGQTVDAIRWQPWDDVLAPLLGWLITAFAATLGAPFWFDLLNKFMVIRSTVKPHEKSPEEGSEDRQPKTPPPAPPAASAAARPVVARPAAAPSAAAAVTHEDFCGVGTGVIATPDERLPPAHGGVA